MEAKLWLIAKPLILVGAFLTKFWFLDGLLGSFGTKERRKWVREFGLRVSLGRTL